MKRLILGAALLLFSTVTFAATEVWMMHDPGCQYCNLFLDNHGIEHGPNHMPEAEFLMHVARNGSAESVVLIIINLRGQNEDVEPRVAKAAGEGKIPNWRGTPTFFRWDTETQKVTGKWTGWRSDMKEQFRNWVLTGTSPIW